MVKQKRLFMISLLLLMLTGCGMMDKASDTLGNFSDEYGDDIMQAIDDLQNTEYQDGPFENNLESAREYLLTQMQEKYRIEFFVVGRENLKNYGPFHGATYFCEVSPVEAPVLVLCGTKDYVIDQRISLEMPETEKLWTAEDKLEQFLSESGAYVKLVLRFTDDLDTEIYAEYLEPWKQIDAYIFDKDMNWVIAVTHEDEYCVQGILKPRRLNDGNF